MEIINFDKVRVGSGFPAVVNISPIYGHESNGLIVSMCNGSRLEIREKAGFHALFVYHPDDENDMPIPEYWRDANVLWRGQ